MLKCHISKCIIAKKKICGIIKQEVIYKSRKCCDVYKRRQDYLYIKFSKAMYFEHPENKIQFGNAIKHR